MEKVLGKIEKATYGMGGYDGAMFGLSVTLAFGGRACSDFKGTWQTRSENAQFSVEEWQRSHLEAALFVMDLLRDAKKKDVSQLAGVPVEVSTDGNSLKSWRVLTEVL